MSSDCTIKEFEVGDIVTFNAYGKPIVAQVKEVLVGYPFGKDNDYSYRLQGMSEPLISIAKGLSIQESTYFKEYTND